jgi:hypothetical protein
VWNPAALFTITDDRISHFWEIRYILRDESSDEALVLAFPEWTYDRRYYERLTEGDPEAVKMFEHYKKLMDKEFLSAGGASVMP